MQAQPLKQGLELQQHREACRRQRRGAIQGEDGGPTKQLQVCNQSGVVLGLARDLLVVGG